MAEKRPFAPTDKPPAAKVRAAAKAPQRPLLTTLHRKASKNIIYEAMTRSGDAFGRPFIAGVSSLTERVVKKLRQKSFFGFETFDRLMARRKANDTDVNKFTKYGAAPYRGDLRAQAEALSATKTEKL